MGIDAILALAGLVLPSAFDFIKKKFIPAENDTAERTMGSLATSKPDILPAYVTALATNRESEVKFFNRDVSGTPSQWVVDLRASIRPIGVVISFIVLGLAVTGVYTPNNELRYTCEIVISSWYGDRIKVS